MSSLNDIYYKNISELLKKKGNCKANGFIGEVTDFKIGTDGLLEYETIHNENGIIVKSIGCVSIDSIIVRQVESKNNMSFSQLYFWNINGSNYTRIVFDSEQALNECYYRVRDNNIDLSKGDIVDKLNSIGVDMEHIANILTDQDTDSLEKMFALNDGTLENSFKR